MGKLTTTLLIALLSLNAVADELQDMKDSWEDTGMSMTFLKTKINNKNCYRSEARFLGCVKGINAMLEAYSGSIENGPYLILSNPTHLKALSRLSLKPGTQSNLVQDFAGGQVYALNLTSSLDGEEPTGKTRSLLNYSRRAKRLETSWRDSWLKVYDTHRLDEQIDFNAVLAWVDSKLPEKRAFYVGTALNVYIKNGEDAHGTIVPQKPYVDNMKKATENFVGIGVELKQIPGTKKLVVVNVFDGMPAQKAGLLPNDILSDIEGIDVSTLGLEKVVPMIRGPEGTTVNLSVSRNSSLMKFSVERRTVTINNVTSAKFPISPGSKALAGYIKIRGFDKESVCEDVETALRDVTADDRVKGLLIDVRDNPGGILSETSCILGLFLGKGQVVMVQKPVIDEDLKSPENSSSIAMEGQKPEPLYTKNEKLTDLPVAVIINPRSASASEVLSGALQGHGRAVIVGERSWGKGTVLAVIPYETASKVSQLASALGLNNGQADDSEVHDLYQIKTISMFYLPPAIGREYHTNQLVGITPDIEAYSVPHPSKLHKYALREKDVLPISLASPETDSPPRNPKVQQKIEACMKSSGTAEKRYAGSDPSVGKDYQLLVSLDALNCQTSRQ